MARKKTHKTKKTGKSKSRKVLWLLLIIIVAGAAVYGGIWFEKNTTIRGVEFTGFYFTDEEELYSAIELPVGEIADSVDYKSIFNDLRQLPYVEDVTVNMSIRGNLNFRVTEYQPLAMLVNGSQRQYLAGGGIRLPVIPGKIKNVPLVYGFPAGGLSDTLSSDAYKQVEGFLTAAANNDTGWATISEVTWSGDAGVVALTHENGVRLVFGNDNFDEKFRNWEVFFAEVISRKGIHSFSSIDLRFKDQIVTKNL